jgi:hypothetical protein
VLNTCACVLGDGVSGDREGEGHGLPAGLLRRLCRGLFLAAAPGCYRVMTLGC